MAERLSNARSTVKNVSVSCMEKRWPHEADVSVLAVKTSMMRVQSVTKMDEKTSRRLCEYGSAEILSSL